VAGEEIMGERYFASSITTSPSCKPFSSAGSKVSHLTSVCSVSSMLHNPIIANAWGPKHVPEKGAIIKGGRVSLSQEGGDPLIVALLLSHPWSEEGRWLDIPSSKVTSRRIPGFPHDFMVT
jgi:hypothetical protein